MLQLWLLYIHCYSSKQKCVKLIIPIILNKPQPLKLVKVDIFARFKGPVLWILISVFGWFNNHLGTATVNGTKSHRRIICSAFSTLILQIFKDQRSFICSIFTGLEIIIFHHVYCTHQISDTVCTGNSDVYTLSHSQEIYLLQSKVRLILYVCFNLFMLTAIEY